MTLPAAIFMLVYGQELVGRDRQIMAYITLVATATAFGGDSSKSMFSTLIQQLGGVEELTAEDLIATASEGQLKFLYGSRYQG